MVSVLNREQKEQDQKAVLNHLMKLAGGQEGRGTDESDTTLLLSTPTGNLVYLAAADMPWPTLVCYLPFFLSNLPGTAEELLRENRKRQWFCRMAEKIQLLPQEPRLSWGRRICCCLYRQTATAGNKGVSVLIERCALHWARDPVPQPSHSIPTDVLQTSRVKEKWRWCYHPGIQLW